MKYSVEYFVLVAAAAALAAIIPSASFGEFSSFRVAMVECAAKSTKPGSIGCESDEKFIDCVAEKSAKNAMNLAMTSNLNEFLCLQVERANVMLAKRGQTALLTSMRIDAGDDQSITKIIEAISTGESIEGQAGPGLAPYRLTPSAQASFRKMLHLRQRYMLQARLPFSDTVASYLPPEPIGANSQAGLKAEDLSKFSVAMKAGIANVLDHGGKSVLTVPPREQFVDDLAEINKFAADEELARSAQSRLDSVLANFLDYKSKKFMSEREEQKNSGTDFYAVAKVDTHVHAAAASDQRMLLAFIGDKISEAHKNSKSFGSDLEKKIGKDNVLPTKMMTTERLDVFAQQETWQNFAKFNKKYEPFGERALRDNVLRKGTEEGKKNFADFLKSVIKKSLENNPATHFEYRLSVETKDEHGWTDFAKWMKKNDLHRQKNVVWMIQLTRTFKLFVRKHPKKSFQDFLSNFFLPLFQATINPEKFPELVEVLESVSGFDSVDDESYVDQIQLDKSSPTPDNWKEEQGNPPFDYYMFYMYSNIALLNQLRSVRGQPAFTFRPHCGEAGTWKHLSTCFLLAEGVNHGVNLRFNTVLQYAYYLAQIGMAMSPISNNRLFLKLKDNPFNLFFSVGLNVSLSTDDPMMFHYTSSLNEEYFNAGHRWSLDTADLSEIARNSVYHYGLNAKAKAKQFGKEFLDAWANDISTTNVPNARIAHRQKVYHSHIQEIASEDSEERRIGQSCGIDCPVSSDGRMTLWHATKGEAAFEIRKGGFKVGRTGKVGAGVYFAEKKSIADSKSNFGAEATIAATVKVGCILTLRVIPSFVRWKQRSVADNQKELERRNCDSIRLVLPITGNEVVVYEHSYVETSHNFMN